ncbi:MULTISPECIES: outer membrane protein [Sphingobium]|uniref:Outer membrane protein beta-barrel domain-containing protein n=1 Tax=Sphingobium fuliginis (strain ATCC 27551) TaxID=336203 RepID=A0A292ZLF9_SPHSA|nr:MULTISPECIES: porin family protein [Sphingobium]AJR23802.1 hypothetical protein TZ53_08780 [Sphingobium sp. YBL2]MCB4858181.1 porin family protein [Sphingobium sp. PNB]PNQ00710.1 hypothetical protein A8G00_17240 [Sphingobium sp. SA916]UXC93063.1 porin family protein [Sphingobium sp. RSMS]WDA35725.1 porin family protein [Sphingobium sp. YC-XJ3]
MKKIIAIAAVAASFASPAFAQDAVRSNFSGPYVGAVVGADHADLGADAHDTGLLYGGVIGYDINLRGAVFGIEGEYADSDTKDSSTDVFVAGDRVSARTGRDLYAGIRIGGQVAENVMLYAKGGYTNARAKGSYQNGATIQTASGNLQGYRLGAGVETNVMGFLARLEYRYSSYERVFDVKPERHQAALVVGYRF